MKFRLRYQTHDFELAAGEFVVGRGNDCQLVLDDGLVSRRHAAFSVDEVGVLVADLGSRNGVLVDGEKVDGTARVPVGSKVRIGSQDMQILAAQAPRAGAQTLAQPAPTLRADAFGLLGGLADKAMAMGRGEEAERILGTHLGNILEDARAGRPVTPELALAAANHAVKVGVATGKGRWIDFVFELFTALSLPMPAELIDELYTAVRKVKGVDVGRLRAYVEAQRPRTRAPAERFLLNRVEGLAPLCSR